ncbi:2-oxoglutarate and iron-dependent oxygenase JMJD4-like [Anneissia japonica]|uniref:2-oxoglutarate and iron-dependent oxygenase JMJD4-like n=1 Tax=Anneissia japonica TaxID=1529436 RepID=UPI0014259B09|nr:2-oxoglutarate and iron-dependent oxygenase JMJD4-like [Anneissia japonica]
MMNIYHEDSELNQARSQVADDVPVLNDILYDVFFEEFMAVNRPCLFSGITDGWRSIKEWVDSDGKPNYQYLSQHFGDAVVPVADCKREQYGSQPKENMLMRDFLSYWKAYIKNDYSKSERCLYLKDWHFTREFPDYGAYRTPVYFTSDWLNEFWDSKQDSQSGDDYRFVYMGPKNSWTPLHADVFRSFSWSANICGKKRWLLYPPGQEVFLRGRHGNLAFDVTSPEMHDVTIFPRFSELQYCFEVIQNAGEVIFVPSGWHHQVFNLEDTISINHNWFNGCNIDIVWNFLQTELLAVKRSISDCREMDEWEEQCQVIMKANTGIDYAEFSQFLTTIAEPRIQLLSQLLTQYELSPMSDVPHTYSDEFENRKIDKRRNIINGNDIRAEHYVQLGVSLESNSDAKELFNETSITDGCSDPENKGRALSVHRDNSADRLPEREKVEKFQANKGHDDGIRDLRSEDEVDWETNCKMDLRRCLLSNDRRHLVFDLRRLKDVIDKLLMELEFKFVKPERLIVNPVEILDKVKTMLTKVENSGLNERV